MSQHTNDSLSGNFALSLKSARGDRSQAEFARFIGIPSQQTYQRYENGLIPSGKMLHQIASKLGVTIDALLSSGTRAEAEAVGKKVLSPGDAPWGKELEENVQMTKAIGIIFQMLSVEQLGRLLKDLGQSPNMPERAKRFWLVTIGQWVVTRLELEEFSKLTPKQKIAARRSQNFIRRADPAAGKLTG